MFQPQMLRQENDVDCGLEVFHALLGLTREEIVADLPGVDKRKTSSDDWIDYAKTKGQELKIYRAGGPALVMLACTISTEGAPSLRFLQGWAAMLLGHSCLC